MTIGTEVANLKEKEIFSLVLFSMYKLRDDPKYSALSELAYLLDKKSLFNLCEFYGGLTITIPTIDELENMIYALILYQYIDIDKKEVNQALEIVSKKVKNLKAVQEAYISIKEVIKNYDIHSR